MRPSCTRLDCKLKDRIIPHVKFIVAQEERRDEEMIKWME